MCIKIKENIGEKESTETRAALRYHGNPLNSQIFIQYKSRIIFIFEKRFYEWTEHESTIMQTQSYPVIYLNFFLYLQ